MNYLYLIKSLDNTKFKIGITNFPNDRIIQIMNDCKFELDLDNSIKFEICSVNQMKNIEYCLHIFFNQFNIKNIDKNFYSKEWFDMICYDEVLKEINFFKEKNFKIGNPMKFININKSKNNNSIWKEKYGFSKMKFNEWNKQIIKYNNDTLKYYALYHILSINQFEYKFLIENDLLICNIIFKNYNPFHKNDLKVELFCNNIISNVHLDIHSFYMFFGFINNTFIFITSNTEKEIKIKFNPNKDIIILNNKFIINDEFIENKINELECILNDAQKNHI